MGIFRTNNMLAGVIAVAALILSGCSGGVTATSGPSTGAPPNTQNLEQAYVSVVETVLPSVVQITTDHASVPALSSTTRAISSPTPTSWARRPRSRCGWRTAPSDPGDPGRDLPTRRPRRIHLDQSTVRAAPSDLGDSSELQLGDIVLAMGNPLGLTGSVTDGIISATGRTVTDPPAAPPGRPLPRPSRPAPRSTRQQRRRARQPGRRRHRRTHAGRDLPGDSGGTAPAPGRIEGEPREGEVAAPERANLRPSPGGDDRRSAGSAARQRPAGLRGPGDPSRSTWRPPSTRRS